ncbi:MAG TPA: FecR domain-containing protein, partial [Burkholderiaceae bacterium]|nr:FecR domain-containing protein [Burkholderiaceae bacterium]
MRIIFILLGFYCLLTYQTGIAQPVTPPPIANSGAPGTVRIGDGQVIYYAQAGDTLSSIAQQLSSRSGNWVALGKLNRISKDISIPIGTAIVIPADLLPDEPNEARIVAFSGSISAIDANGGAVRIAPGSILREGASVETGANSFLTLALTDQSRISIPSNSRIALSRLRMARYTNSPRTEVSILRGRIETRVAPLHINRGRFEVRSPQSVTGVRGTHFRVALADGRVNHEVLSGSVMVNRPGASSGVLLRQGQGAIVGAERAPAAVQLLPAPQLAAAPVADGASVRFDLVPVTGASAYQVQIATDSEGQDVVAESIGAEPRLN